MLMMIMMTMIKVDFSGVGWKSDTSVLNQSLNLPVVKEIQITLDTEMKSV